MATKTHSDRDFSRVFTRFAPGEGWAKEFTSEVYICLPATRASQSLGITPADTHSPFSLAIPALSASASSA
ncbi:regulatory protein GntR [Schaalia cardiffensis F0333]|uniref:Regulatory protein GntR n=1 Tax=Schaalia cardiffensis F0333 TaxID=888050 RepID=N6XAL5_9ACTO|nr:regulatory protein GntR [Schaalia cardiffensis F0333]